jgi:regulator of CtrA degradation
MRGHDAITMHRRLVDSLYVEAMVLADEARSYFDQLGRDERDALEALTRVAFSCESLKVTTRLMHVIAWLLTQRAVDAGELQLDDARAPGRRLGPAPETDSALLEQMPHQAVAIVRASIDLYRRVARLDSAFDVPTVAVPSPARRMLDRLAGAF